MNTWVTVTGADADLAPWFETVEANLSRFRPDSPLSQLNRMPERWVVVPPLLFDALTQALAAAEATGGAYDPTILSALEASGYSRSFDVGASPVAPSQPAGRWPQVKLDHALNAVWLPGGVRIDLGGIGKGFAVDGGLDRLTGAPRALINAGGDLAVRTAPDDGPVLIAVADPWDHWQTIASFGVCRGAVATSSTLGRRWGDGLHHIIDPRTGRPTASGVVAATVVSGSAVQADVLAKACIVLVPSRRSRSSALTNPKPSGYRGIWRAARPSGNCSGPGSSVGGRESSPTYCFGPPSASACCNQAAC